MNCQKSGAISCSREQLMSFLYGMQRIRRAEERIGELVASREVRTPCHLSIGQEAIPVGVCAALNEDDTVWGGHRSHGHYLAKGGDLNAMMAEIFGKATGCARGRGGSMHLVAPAQGIFGTVPLVAATIPLAVGAALSGKLRGTHQVAVAFFGDGATDEGHFHESLNLAALYRLPVLFVCENNLYSTHLTLKERRVKDNIVESAALHGLAGVTVDGNDVTAVYQAAQQAVHLARIGKGQPCWSVGPIDGAGMLGRRPISRSARIGGVSWMSGSAMIQSRSAGRCSVPAGCPPTRWIASLRRCGRRLRRP